MQRTDKTDDRPFCIKVAPCPGAIGNGLGIPRMHESFFGLQKRPFLTVPTLDRYCPVTSQEQAFQACHRAVTRAEGPVAVLGGTGLGKSMVCLRIAESFRRSFEVILLASSQICSRRALLQSLLFELRMPYRDLNEGELRLSLLDRLQPSNENPSDGLVLIVDEAQTLSIKLLEELRMLTNLTRDGQPRVRLVLCGTHRLDEMLGHPQLESLNQRLAGRCYLSPLGANETATYITHKIERCGASIHGVLTDEALQMVHRATDGVPRLIDQLCDQALRLASENRQRPCSASLIEAAWASLQQLPLPWSDTGTPIEEASSTIEFGSLDEDAENEFAVPAQTHSPQPPQSSLGHSYGRGTENAFFEASTQRGFSDAIDSDELDSDGQAFGNYDEAESRRLYSQDDFPTMPSYSPIPSAGMGLSGFAPKMPTSTTEPIAQESVGHNDAWEDFLAAQRFELKPLRQADFQNESFIVAPQVDSVRWLPDTVDYQPSDQQPVAETYEAPFVPQPVEPIHPAFNRVPSNEQLFGNDFEEEIAVESPHPASSTESLPAYTYDDLPVSSYATEDALAYEVEQLPSDRAEPADQTYSELLDTLSSTNLEAMTFDPSTTIQPTATYEDRRPTASPGFEGGLSRSSRSTILSFVDLQQTQAPMVGDDRDLLVIEEDLPNQIASIPTEPAAPAVVHPYKQLFSKLRG